MGYYASGNGDATLKEGVKEDLERLLKGARDEIDCDIEWDISEDRIDFWQSDSHWHEEDTLEFLNMLIPYITEGSMYYSGEDDCHWRYVFDPENDVWIDEGGEVIFDLSDISDEDLLEEVRKRGLKIV